MKSKLKKLQFVRNIYFSIHPLKSFFVFKPLLMLKQYKWFFRTFKNFKKEINPSFSKIEFQPCLFDNLSYTPLDPVYFYQDTWASKKIFELKPKHHVDIGSNAKTVGIISQFVPTTMVDIRPIKLKLNNLFFVKGSILNLPFKDNSVESVSSLCVVEHIGLGRYGDKIDVYGSEKAISELKRVVKVGGVILFSVPVDKENKVYYNAHRAFTRDYILSLFDNFKLIEEKYQYGGAIYDKYDPDKGFGTGLFMFIKKEK